MSAASLINVLAVNLHYGPGWEGEGGNPLVFFIFIFLTVAWLWLVSGKLGSACLLCCSLCGFLRPLSTQSPLQACSDTKAVYKFSPSSSALCLLPFSCHLLCKRSFQVSHGLSQEVRRKKKEEVSITSCEEYRPKSVFVGFVYSFLSYRLWLCCLK